MFDWQDKVQQTEMIAFKSKISTLESQISELKTQNYKQRIDNDYKETKLKNELESVKKQMKQLEVQAQNAQEAKNAVQHELENCKTLSLEQNFHFDKQKTEFENRIEELERNFEQASTDKNNCLAEMSKQQATLLHQINQLKNELNKANMEIDLFKVEIENQQIPKLQFDFLKTQVTEKDTEISNLKKQLESYEEGRLLEQVLKGEISQFKQVQEENSRLKNQVDLLSDVREDNVVMKEKILDYQTENAQLKEMIAQKNVDLCELKYARDRLDQWTRIVGIDSPDIVANQMEELKKTVTMVRLENESLKSDIQILKSETSSHNLSIESSEVELKEAKKTIEELKDRVKKLNRKNLLYSKEKESYRKIIVSYGSETTMSSDDDVLQTRIKDLESIVDDYKQILDDKEQELAQATERAQDATEKQKQIDLLKLELAHIKSANSNIYTGNLSQMDLPVQRAQGKEYRVIHFTNNPLTQSINSYVEEHIKLSQENLRLKCMIDLLESGNVADMTRQLDEGLKQKDEVERLQQAIKKLEANQKSMNSSFKAVAQKMRQACALLTGYQISNISSNRYQLIHQYDPAKRNLLFELNKGSIKMLDSDDQSMSGLNDLIQTYLSEHDSYPAFLAAYTLKLFSQQTIL